MQLDKGFYRRLKFYLFGFLLGALIVNIVFKGKACRLPGTVKLEELREQKREYTPRARCQMSCSRINTAEIELLLQQGKINYGKSNVHASPCGTYAVEGTAKNSGQISLVIHDCDSISKITNLILDKDTCNCK